MKRTLIITLILIAILPTMAWANHPRALTKEETEELSRMVREMMPPEQRKQVEDMEALQRLKGRAGLQHIPEVVNPPTQAEVDQMFEESLKAYDYYPECPPLPTEEELAQRKPEPIVVPGQVPPTPPSLKDPKTKICVDKAIKEDRLKFAEERRKPHTPYEPPVLKEMREQYRKFKEEQQKKATPQ